MWAVRVQDKTCEWVSKRERHRNVSSEYLCARFGVVVGCFFSAKIGYDSPVDWLWSAATDCSCFSYVAIAVVVVCVVFLSIPLALCVLRERLVVHFLCAFPLTTPFQIYKHLINSDQQMFFERIVFSSLLFYLVVLCHRLSKTTRHLADWKDQAISVAESLRRCIHRYITQWNSFAPAVCVTLGLS